MKKTFRRITAVLTAAMTVAAVMAPVYAAETSSDTAAQVVLLETKDGKPVDDAALADTKLSKYEDFFKAIGATDEQIDAIYLAGQVKLDIGSVVELQMLQPAQKDNPEADLTLLVGKQAAVSILGPKDGKTVEDADHNKYLPLTVKGEKEGTDVYVANVEPYGICAYEFVVGSGEGETNTNPALYGNVAVVNTASASNEVTEEVKTINYNPSPLGVSLSNAGSSWLSQGGVKEDGKQIDGVTLAGHAKYSAAAPVVSAPKTIRVGALNPEEIITISNTSGKAAKAQETPERIGLLNEEEIITINNASGKAEKTEAKPVRNGMLNEEEIITISNASGKAEKTEAKPVRNGMLNEEEIITISNASGKAEKTEAKPVRNGMLNEEEIITISNASGKAEKTEAKPARIGTLNPEDIIQIL